MDSSSDEGRPFKWEVRKHMTKQIFPEMDDSLLSSCDFKHRRKCYEFILHYSDNLQAESDISKLDINTRSLILQLQAGKDGFDHLSKLEKCYAKLIRNGHIKLADAELEDEPRAYDFSYKNLKSIWGDNDLISAVEQGRQFGKKYTSLEKKGRPRRKKESGVNATKFNGFYTHFLKQCYDDDD